MGAGWNAVRLGLLLNRIGAKVIALVFLLNAAITLALAPWVIGREINPIIGFFTALAIGIIYLGIVRRAYILQSEELVTQIVFIVFSIIVCQLVYAHPHTLKHILVIATQITPIILLASIALTIVGCFFCLFAWAGLSTWLYSAGTFVSLLATGVIALRLTSQAEEIRWIQGVIPSQFRDAQMLNFPLISPVGLICIGTIAVLFHAFYLRGVSKHFHDSSTQDYIWKYIGYQVAASVVIFASYFFLRNYQTKEILILGESIFDSLTIGADSFVSLLIAVSAIWLGYCIGGAGGLINPHRR